MVDRSGELNESQNVRAFFLSVAILAGLALLMAVCMIIYGKRLNRRVEVLEKANPGSIVLNVDKRHGTGFVEGLLGLGASNVGKPTIFAVVADDFGLRFYSGYSPPVLVIAIPWENTLSITRGDFALGMRTIPRISVRVMAAKNRVVEIPITPNQVGWAIFNFSSRPRIESLVDQLNSRRGQSPSLANSGSDRKG